MSGVNVSGDGRKRPWTPPVSNPPKKKTKKLSAIALRALAALASDSESESSEDDGGGEESQRQERHERDSLPASRAAMATAEPVICSDETTVAAGADEDREAIINSNKSHTDADMYVAKETDPSSDEGDKNKNSDQNFEGGFQEREPSGDAATRDHNLAVSKQNGRSPTREQMKEAEPSRGTGADEKEDLNGNSAGEFQNSEPNEETPNTKGGDTIAESKQNRPSPAATPMPPKDNNVVDDDLTMAQSDCAALGDHQNHGVISPAADEDVVVRPHEHTSEYNDILSYFLSTPFDDKAMLAMHRLKEGSASDRATKRQAKKSFDRWISSGNADLPIIPQKIYCKNLRGKHSAASKEQQSLQNSFNCGSVPISSGVINGEVISFLLREGQNLINSSLPSNTVHNHNNFPNQQQASFRYPPAPSINQPHTNNQQAPSYQYPPAPAIHQRSQPTNDAHVIASNRQQAPYQYRTVPSALTQRVQPQITQQQPPRYHQFSQQQNSFNSRPMLNSYNPIPQMHHGYQQQPVNGWQYPRPFAGPAPAFQQGHSIANARKKFASASSIPAVHVPAQKVIQQKTTLVQHPTASSRPEMNAARAPPKVATASAEFKVTNLNINEVAKLPLSFGFLLDDDGSSKSLACIALTKWIQEGNSAAKSESKKRGFHSPQKNKSPRNAMTPPSEPAGPSFPDGWTFKTFQRGVSGGTSRSNSTTYKVFYSPLKKIKFRSRKSCHIFIGILNEPGINADEERAFEVFKSRGHKL